jgi:hypothetical protein
LLFCYVYRVRSIAFNVVDIDMQQAANKGRRSVTFRVSTCGCFENFWTQRGIVSNRLRCRVALLQAAYRRFLVAVLVALRLRIWFK